MDVKKRDAQIQLLLLPRAVSLSSQGQISLKPHQPDSTRAEGRDFDLADPEGEGKAAAEGTAETRAPLQAVEGRGDVWGAKQLPKAREDPRGWQKESGFEFTSFVSDSKEFKQYLQINFPCLRKGECLVH